MFNKGVGEGISQGRDGGGVGRECAEGAAGAVSQKPTPQQGI